MRILIIISAMCVAQGASAQEWAGWRGGQQGVVLKDQAPARWPAAVTQQWRLPVGEGCSSPVASGGLVFVHSRNDPEEVVTAVDAASGKVKWRKTYPAPYEKNQYATKMMKGPNSTPLVAEGRLYTLGATGILTAWKTADGALLWRNDYSDSVTMSKLFCGTSASPIMDEGSLIVNVGSDQHGGRILALDPATGKERWKWSGEGPGYATPTAVTVDGIRQIITLTGGSVVGVDSKTGEGLWTIPFKDEWEENIVTPIWTGQQLIVSGTRLGTMAYDLHHEGDKWRAERGWHNTDVPMYMSSPVLLSGTLYGFSNKKRGHLFALDTKTGEVKWASEGRDGDNACVLLTPTNVVYLTSAGSLRIVAPNPSKYEEVRRLDVAESQTWCVPILLPDGMILRDRDGLMRIRFGP